MNSEEYEMQAFRSSAAKMEPLCLPPPPPPPPLPRPSFMPPPPPPLSQAPKRYEPAGSSPVVRPVQNRFLKPPDQRPFQRPPHLPFLLPPPPPKFRNHAHRQHASPAAQYRAVSQSTSLQRRNLEVNDNSTSATIPTAEEEPSQLKTPTVKEETGPTEPVVRDDMEEKSCTSEDVNMPNKTHRKRPSEKESDSSSGLPKELTQKFGPLTCELCSVSVNSTVQAKMHYSGRQHEKKVHSFLLNWSKETGEPLPKQFKDGPPKKSVPDVSFCEVCNVALTSTAHAEQHYMGRNHRRALAGHAAAKAKVEQCAVPTNDQTGRFGIGTQFQPWSNADPLVLKAPEPDSPIQKTKKFFCELCKVAATSQDQLDMHLRGAKHRKAETANKQRSTVTSTTPQATQSDSILASVIQNEDGTQSSVGKDYSIYRTPSGYYYCQPCNLTLNSEAQFIQHCESKKHKVKTATAKKPVGSPLKAGNVVA
ncbi:zinc finger protein 346-like [Schistocerca cancellata]|uniref:zinc finger protein 346-like n=1 Tax=Schistocerca cancellata TaxID=274614 RepID=UPI002118F7E0|nr:zinc finger protein 346-like [Schistocerca cancellata]XP_049777541.1 zinc finger protein 346-like [Schistocerca cancellata]